MKLNVKGLVFVGFAAAVFANAAQAAIPEGAAAQAKQLPQLNLLKQHTLKVLKNMVRTVR